MGSRDGALRTAAARVGVSVDDYVALVDSGKKWCTKCRAWHPLDAFPIDRSRGDGRRARCLASGRGQPRGTRDPLHERARRAVGYAVRAGKLSRPDSLPCADCGHQGEDRRHEYDHHAGYASENHLNVEPVCTLCHADREKSRRHG